MPYKFKEDKDIEEEHKEFSTWMLGGTGSPEIIVCCSCNKEDVDHMRECYYCGGNYCVNCDETCIAPDCDKSICKACFDKSSGRFMERCNDCYLLEYGTGEEPDYPHDEGLDVEDH